MKHKITELIIIYKNKIVGLEKDQDSVEYEAAPSGEVNESMIPYDQLQYEIDAYEEVVKDLEKIVEDI